MLDRGFFLTWQAVRRQLAAMPQSLYLIRLIHYATRRAFPGERLWTAAQLTSAVTIRFLRVRNREGCDIYILPYGEDYNAGFILLDLDAADPAAVDSLCRDGLEPCVVLQTSPGHLQAWLHLSHGPLPPALATAAARQLARAYDGDPASADWRHLGRLAGFTNRKPVRRTAAGYQPWVTVQSTRPGLASRADAFLRSLPAIDIAPGLPQPGFPPTADHAAPPASITPAEAIHTYQHYLLRWRIAERFPRPDWSIVDLWVARALLSQATPAAHVQAVLQLGSPGFPRRHGNPEDYLRRTLARAAFPRTAPPPPVCHPRLPPLGGSSTAASVAL